MRRRERSMRVKWGGHQFPSFSSTWRSAWAIVAPRDCMVVTCNGIDGVKNLSFTFQIDVQVHQGMIGRSINALASARCCASPPERASPVANAGIQASAGPKDRRGRRCAVIHRSLRGWRSNVRTQRQRKGRWFVQQRQFASGLHCRGTWGVINH